MFLSLLIVPREQSEEMQFQMNLKSQPNLGEEGDSILLKVTTIPLLKQIQVINLIFLF
ncbi:hypothetical protein Hanom_Chr07g00628671 [Helianthus anomalus]